MAARTGRADSARAGSTERSPTTPRLALDEHQRGGVGLAHAFTLGNGPWTCAGGGSILGQQSVLNWGGGSMTDVRTAEATEERARTRSATTTTPPSAPSCPHAEEIDALARRASLHAQHVRERVLDVHQRRDDPRGAAASGRLLELGGDRAGPRPSVQVDPRDARSPRAHDVAPAAGAALRPQGDGAARGQGRERCVSLIDGFAGTGHCDFLRDFAWRYPTTIFMELMGLPLDGLEQFLDWEHQILHPSAEDDPEHTQGIEAMMAVMGYFAELIEEKRAHPADDLLSSSLEWRIDGAADPDGGPPVVVPPHVHGRPRHRLDPARVRVLAPGRASRRPHPDRPRTPR